MCSNCQDVLIGFAIPHPTNACPLLRASYCSVCCSYDHRTEDCPDEEILECREVQYMEQLIPHSMLQAYGIQSRTPLDQGRALKKPKFEPVLEVEDSDKAIRAILMDYYIQPSGKMKENRRLLKQVADQEKRKLVYLAPR
jgi:hypothetical protein